MSDTRKPTREGSSGDAYVFVSYARADEKQAKAVIACIEKAGFRTWWDGLIPGGDRFGARIGEALEGAGAVVVLWSEHSLQSNWVQDEAEWGRDHHRLVPISLDGSLPPLGFRQLQCLDLSQGGARASNPEMRRAIRAIGDMLGREPEDEAPVVAGGPAPVSRRTAVIGGGAVAAGAIGVGVWQWTRPDSAAANTIAVLPFANLSGDPAKAYLSDGLAAELRATLARNAALRVVGQASSNSVRNPVDDSRKIARRLNVANLLDGNVLAAGNMVRIAVELIDGRSGFTRWSRKFERPVDDVLALQDEVAQAIGAALALRLADGAADAQDNGGGTKSARAFDAFLRGKESFDSQHDEASDRAALAAFSEAVRIDPHYAAARAARSRSLAVIANAYPQANERRRLYTEAVSEARAAVADAPRFADAYAALGYALFYGKLDIIAADGPYEQARRFGSGSADTLGLYAVYNARRRRFDRAMAAIDRAASLDPINPNVFKSRGRIRFAARDYDGAIAGARRSLALNPDIGGSHGDIGNALLLQGKTAEAAVQFEREKVALLAIPGRAFVALREGRGNDAKQAFDELIRSQGDNGLYQQAQILAQAGQLDTALGALEKAAAAQDSGLVYLLIDPFLEPLRQDPRFKSLLQRLHFV